MNIYIPIVFSGETVKVEMLSIVNKHREDHGLSNLTPHEGLNRAAQMWADEMMGTGVFEHGNFAERVAEQYPGWKTIGENLAAGFNSVESAVKAWMDSPGHRNNILNPDFEETGIGYAKGGQVYQHWYVMDYGARFKV